MKMKPLCTYNELSTQTTRMYYRGRPQVRNFQKKIKLRFPQKKKEKPSKKTPQPNWATKYETPNKKPKAAAPNQKKWGALERG